MFSNLKQGSNLWILHPNSATPFVEVGIVEPTNNIMPMAYFPVDISVRVGERVIPFRQLPPNSETATGTDQSGESIIIACSKEAMCREVDVMMQKSIEVINSVEYHKNRIAVFGDLKKQLNPELAEKEAQAKELAELREEMRLMRERFAELQGETSS